MVKGSVWLIGHVINERLLKNIGGFVSQPSGKGSQDCKIGRTFKIQHASLQVRLVVLIKSDITE